MRLNSISLLALAMVTLAVDCKTGDLLSPTDGMLRTDAAEYVLREDDGTLRTDIGLTFANRTGRPVYIPSCHGAHPPVLEKLENGRWVTAYAPIVLLCLGPPVVIPAGTTYEYEYRVRSARPGTNAALQFSVVPIAGTYRAVWGLFHEKLADGTTTKLLPLESRTSNTFEIRQP